MEEVMMTKKEWMDTHELSMDDVIPFKECNLLNCSECPFSEMFKLKISEVRLSGDCFDRVKEYIELKDKIEKWKELRK